MGNLTKYHINNEGEIFKVNKDGTVTSIGNVKDINPNTPKAKGLWGWLISEFNWLYCISIVMLIVMSTICIGHKAYYDSSLIEGLAMCLGITSFIIPWIFRTLKSYLWIIFLILLISSIIAIIVFSYEWTYTTQTILGFFCLLSFIIIWLKSYK